MVRHLVLVATIASLLDVTAAEAAKRHWRPRNAAVVATPLRQPITPQRPMWAPEGACFTDEGYGRFLPCGMGGRGG